MIVPTWVDLELEILDKAERMIVMSKVGNFFVGLVSVTDEAITKAASKTKDTVVALEQKGAAVKAQKAAQVAIEAQMQDMLVLFMQEQIKQGKIKVGANGAIEQASKIIRIN